MKKVEVLVKERKTKYFIKGTKDDISPFGFHKTKFGKVFELTDKELKDICNMTTVNIEDIKKL